MPTLLDIIVLRLADNHPPIAGPPSSSSGARPSQKRVVHSWNKLPGQPPLEKVLTEEEAENQEGIDEKLTLRMRRLSKQARPLC